MATFYGSWVATDDFRTVLVATVSEKSATQCEVELTVRCQSTYAWANDSGRASCTCDGTTRRAEHGIAEGSTTTMMTETFTVARGAKDRKVAVKGKTWIVNSGIGSYGTGSTASGTVTIPAIDYGAPAAPSSCSASRASDSQAKVSWKNGAVSDTAPRSKTLIERQTDSGAWVQVASASASAANWTDNTVSANRRYRYRVRAQGAGGYSGYATSGYIYTTPAAPASVSLEKTGAGVEVDIAGDAPWATSWSVERSADGGSEWEPAGTASAWPWTDADAPAGTVRYRVRAERGSLASAWTESADITTICPPAAPAVTLSPPGPVLATGTPLTVLWVPSHPDGSAQSAAQVEWTAGGEPTVEDVEGAQASLRLPDAATAAACGLEVRVRTKGIDEGWGAWSAPVAARIAVPPAAAITSPAVDGQAVDALPLAVAWEASDATGVSAQTLELLDATGAVLVSARMGAGARSAQIGPADAPWENGAAYSLRLTVSGGSSLSTAAVRAFSTDWAEPAAPDAEVEVQPGDLSCAVTAFAGSAEGLPPAVSLDVARVLADGSRWVLADGLADGMQVVDRLPPLNVDFSYEVVATAATGATSRALIAARVDSNAVALSFGAGAEECALLALDPDWSRSAALEVELLDFADGGESGGLPVGYATGALSSGMSHSATVLDRAEAAALEGIARRHPFGWFRDLYGNRYYCAVSFSFSGGVGRAVTVSVDMDETVWREVARG